MPTIDLRHDNLNPPRIENDGPIKTMISYSSYDVPTAIEADFDTRNRLLILRFNYIGGIESTRRHTLSNFMWAYIGKNSRRLCRVELDWSWAEREIIEPLREERQKSGDMTKLGDEAARIVLDRMEEKLKPFLEDLHKKHPHPNRVGNYSTTQHALASHRRALMPVQSVATS